MYSLHCSKGFSAVLTSIALTALTNLTAVTRGSPPLGVTFCDRPVAAGWKEARVAQARKHYQSLLSPAEQGAIRHPQQSPAVGTATIPKYSPEKAPH